MNWKTIFKSLKNRDMQKRVGVVLELIVVYRFLAHVPVPLAEPTKLKQVIDSVVNASDFGGVPKPAVWWCASELFNRIGGTQSIHYS